MDIAPTTKKGEMNVGPLGFNLTPLLETLNRLATAFERLADAQERANTLYLEPTKSR